MPINDQNPILHLGRGIHHIPPSASLMDCEAVSFAVAAAPIASAVKRRLVMPIVALLIELGYVECNIIHSSLQFTATLLNVAVLRKEN